MSEQPKPSLVERLATTLASIHKDAVGRGAIIDVYAPDSRAILRELAAALREMPEEVLTIKELADWLDREAASSDG